MTQSPKEWFFGMLTAFGYYLCTLLVYLPGLIFLFNRKRSLQFPITAFTFLGMFVFNALGSILIISPELTGRPNFFSNEYLLMLNLQVLIFYIIAIPYVACTRYCDYRIVSDYSIDNLFLKFLCLIIAGIVGCYIFLIGAPPLVSILADGLNMKEIIKIRTQTFFGHSDIWIYNLGFTTIPMLTAIYALGRKAVFPERILRVRWIILGCLCISALPGGKGSILEFGTALLIAYYLLSGWSRSKREADSFRNNGLRKKIAPLRFSYKKAFLYLVVAFVPTLLMYRIYFGSLLSFGDILMQLVIRIVGVYSEVMAATVSYVGQHSLLDGSTLPTIRGLLGHERLNVGIEMHQFMFGNMGSVTLSGPAEGYINFGWWGFCLMSVATYGSMILVEQVLTRMHRNVLTVSLLVFYSVLATKNAQLSLFLTFVSLTYVVTFGLMILARNVLAIGFRFRFGLAVPEVR
jgi:hypothetical protein